MQLMNNLKKAVLKVFNGNPTKGGSFEGSAFLISNYNILTCKHVIENINEEDIFLLGDGAWDGGGVRKIFSKQCHPDRDIAIMSLNKPTVNNTYLQLADSSQLLSIGDELTLLGCTSADRPIESPIVIVSAYDGVYDLDITHTKVQKGMSGGPAIQNNTVMGITQAREDAHTLIIPISSVKTFTYNHTKNIDRTYSMPILPDELEELCIILNRSAGLVRAISEDVEKFFYKYAPLGMDWIYIQENNLCSTVIAMVRKLGDAPIQMPQNTHPLLDLVQYLVNFSKRNKSLQQDMHILKSWLLKVASRNGANIQLQERLTPSKLLDHAYLMIQIRFVDPETIDFAALDQTQIYVDAWLLLGDSSDTAEPKPLLHDKPCKLIEVSSELSDLLRICRPQLASMASELTIEFFLPLELMLYDIDKLNIPTGFRRGSRHPEVIIGQEFCVVVRSYDRIAPETKDHLGHQWKVKWFKCKNLLSTRINFDRFHWVYQEEDCCDLGSFRACLSRDEIIGLIQTFSLSIRDNCEDIETALDILEQIIETGMPLALLFRQSLKNSKAARESVQSWCKDAELSHFPKIIQKLRVNATLSDDKQHHGNHLTLIWDDPQRVPPDIIYTQPMKQAIS